MRNLQVARTFDTVADLLAVRGDRLTLAHKQRARRSGLHSPSLYCYSTLPKNATQELVSS